MTNYRLISLLTSFSEVVEKVIYDRILQHIEVINCLVREQFGFRPCPSTERPTILKAVNNRLMVRGIFCDLQRAFDYVNYSILLTNLEFCGIRGTFP
jgi:hypothetical protein